MPCRAGKREDAGVVGNLRRRAYRTGRPVFQGSRALRSASAVRGLAAFRRGARRGSRKAPDARGDRGPHAVFAASGCAADAVRAVPRHIRRESLRGIGRAAARALRPAEEIHGGGAHPPYFDDHGAERRDGREVEQRAAGARRGAAARHPGEHLLRPAQRRARQHRHGI